MKGGKEGRRKERAVSEVIITIAEIQRRGGAGALALPSN